jgi:hypothetical protein
MAWQEVSAQRARVAWWEGAQVGSPAGGAPARGRLGARAAAGECPRQRRANEYGENALRMIKTL